MSRLHFDSKSFTTAETRYVHLHKPLKLLLRRLLELRYLRNYSQLINFLENYMKGTHNEAEVSVSSHVSAP
jgi:hypothetical protein